MSETAERTDSYLRTLLLLLLAATFFEGYDGAILALVLPGIRDTFNVPESALGISRAIIELGLGGAFFLARAGDHWGRRRLLLFSVLGYTVMTTLTAFSWDLWSFTAFQSLSRVFLGAEYAVALTMIVEEFPKDRRARAIGILLMCSAVGAVAVALMLLAGIADIGRLEWRTLYLVGVIPLLFLAFFRRRLKETRRFEAHSLSVSAAGGSLRVSFFEPWRRPFRRTLVLVGLVHLLRSLPLFGATSWFFYFAEREAGMEQAVLYLVFIIAYGFGTLGYWVCGTLMDRVGRRPTAIVYGLLATVSAFMLFQARGALAIGVLLVVAVFFGLGVAPVLGAISTELFPTYIRNQSAAWSRNVFEIAGFILGPLLVGVLGDHYTGALGSIGDTVSMLMLLFLAATWLVMRHLPETKGRELEEIEEDLGVADAAALAQREPAAAPSTRFWLAAAIVALLVAGGVIVGVKELGSVTRRPEGAAERFLQAVSGDDEAGISRFGSASVIRPLFGTPDPPEFEQIEVGKALEIASLYNVPFHVTFDTEPARELTATLQVFPSGPADPQELKVVGYAPRASVKLQPVPSEGRAGEPAGAPPAAWIAALVTVALATVACELFLRVLAARAGQLERR